MPDIDTTFNFLQWQDIYKVEKPFLCFVNVPEDAEDKRDNNLVFESRVAKVWDIRSNVAEYTLNDNGFMVREHMTDLRLDDPKVVEEKYLPEVERLLRSEIDGIERIFIFDWRLRRNEPERWGDVVDLNDSGAWLRPVFSAHNDQSAAAVLNRVRRQLPDEADDLLKGRVRVVNVWRPINHPVRDCPLAFCDGSTVDMTDLIETDHVRRHYTGSNLYSMYNPRTRWHYISSQRPDEVLFMKMFDSKCDVKACCCPHASFEIPDTPPGTIPRESIEVRALLFSVYDVHSLHNWDLVFDLVEYVLNKLVQEQWGNELLCMAASAGCIPIIQRLMTTAQHQAELRTELLRDIRRDQQPPSFGKSMHQSVGEAVLGNHVDVVEDLLGEKGIEAHLQHLNSRGENVLHLASGLCNPAMFRLLVPHFQGGMRQTDDQGDTALVRIVMSSSDPRDRHASARILLSQGSANRNSHFWNEQRDPLRIAVRLGDLDMCYLLMSIGRMSPLSALTPGHDGQMILKDTAPENQENMLAILQLLLTYANVASKSADDSSVVRMPSEKHLDRSTS